MVHIADGTVADGTEERRGEPSRPEPTNEEVAEILERIAELTEAQDANPFRVGAYRNAARTVRRRPRPVVSILEAEGIAGLEGLPGIGRGIASLIEELAETGRVRLLDRLEGAASPESVFARVPGIGDVLAGRIRRELGIETLEELELAAHDGRLAEVEGFGERKVQGVRDALAGMLGRSRRGRRGRRLRPPAIGGDGWDAGDPRRRLRVGGRAAGSGRPGPRGPGVERIAVKRDPASRPGDGGRAGKASVADILSVDAEYRRRAEAGELRKIAPRRFNPDGTAWLPILRTGRDGRSFTALYSNTARAHRLGKTRDWVVVYWDSGGDGDQATVVTEYRGVLEGLRVVRGWEEECLEHYRREGHVWAEDGEGAEQVSLALG